MQTLHEHLLLVVVLEAALGVCERDSDEVRDVDGLAEAGRGRAVEVEVGPRRGRELVQPPVRRQQPPLHRRERLQILNLDMTYSISPISNTI